ncbi:MAG: uroporphyrinogen-III synthase [Ignavibacteriaceae bacterium]
MLVKENRKTKKARKREQILEVAANLFSRKNYHEVMMDDVARLTDIAKGTVYNYFESKEELYFSIMSLKLNNLNTSLKEKLSGEISCIESLHSYVIHLYMFMIKYQSFFLMYQKEYLNAENEFCDQLKSHNEELKSILQGVLRRGIRENQFRDVEEDFAVKLILGSIFGAVQRGIENNYSGQTLADERERLFDFVLHGLYSGFNTNSVRPLKNKKFVLTRTVEQSKESASAFSELGAEVIIFPTLEIVPPSSWDEFDRIVSEQDKIDFIILTSAHAVKMYAKRLKELNIEILYKQIKVVAVGSKTYSVCEKHNVPVHIIPKKFSGEGVVEALSKYDLKNKLVFIPRSAIGREDLPHGLAELGAIIKTVPVYNVSLPTKENISENIKRLNNSKPDLFIFTSPSTFENFLQIMDITNPISYFNGYDIAAIGPTTQSAIESKKVKVNIMPDEFTIQGLVKKVIEYYK